MMTEKDVCRALGMDEAICDQLPEFAEGEYEHLRALIKEDPHAYSEAMWKMPEPEAHALRFSLRYAGEVREIYREKGYDDQIWLDSFADIRIWNESYTDRFGKPGIDEIGWISYSLAMKLFRLGRLQFLPHPLEEDIVTPERTVPAGTVVLTVHIPAGTPLRHDDCLASYEMAKKFYNDPHPVFTCGSWLLSPALKELLPETSGILAFQSDFTLLSTNDKSRQAEERIYGHGNMLDDPSGYPEDTTLRRNAKAWLMAGKKIPSGYGVIFG